MFEIFVFDFVLLVRWLVDVRLLALNIISVTVSKLWPGWPGFYGGGNFKFPARYCRNLGNLVLSVIL